MRFRKIFIKACNGKNAMVYLGAILRILVHIFMHQSGGLNIFCMA